MHLRFQIELKLFGDWGPQCSPLLVTPTTPAWCGVSTCISGWSVSKTGLYSQVAGVVGGSDRATGLNSICNSARWPAEGGLLPAAAQGFLQFPIWEPLLMVLPSPWGCRLELALDIWCSWWWRKYRAGYWPQNMKLSAVRERGREISPGDPCCVWRLRVTLGHDLSPQNTVVWRQWASGCYWPVLLGQGSVISQCPQGPHSRHYRK